MHKIPTDGSTIVKHFLTLQHLHEAFINQKPKPLLGEKYVTRKERKKKRKKMSKIVDTKLPMHCQGQRTHLAHTNFSIFLLKPEARPVYRNSIICENNRGRERFNIWKFPRTPMGVLAPGSAHARPSAQPHIGVCGNFPLRMSAESPLNISPKPSARNFFN